MANPEDNLMISDKVWILVGMLLRNGQSCTPSQLSNLCLMLRITSSEIDWLCKLPFSPLCLSECGRVTFSQFMFHFFDSVKERYATSSLSMTSWKCSFNKDSVSTSSLMLPILCSQRLHQPSLPYEFSYKESHGCFSPLNFNGANPKQITGEAVRESSNFEVKQCVRKRLREITFIPANKKQNISTIVSCEQVGDAKEMNLCVSGRRSSSTLQSTAAQEADQSCAISISLDAKQFLEVPLKLDGFTESASCYSQQSCTATVTCLGDHMAEFDQDMSVSLPLDRQSSMHSTVNNRGGDPSSAIMQPCFTSSYGELEILANISASHHNAKTPNTLSMGSPLEKNEYVLSREGGQKVEGELPMHEILPEFVENIPTFVQNSDKLAEEHITVGDVALNEKNAATCLNRQCELTREESHRHNHAEGHWNNAIGADPSGCKLSKHKGKTIKDPHQKNLSSIQVTKLRKLKKASVTKKQLHTAGCSAVMEACSNQLVEDKHPSFAGFIVEAVEGSGGYGTVYKAMKKDCGKLVAIKYPFERTSYRHVQNEIKVLQKYGGHNFIPKCLEVIEESGKQCLVLDYIEHEKPEILKKEISISELQFYGFSLFKALEYLHSKGVVHRDVKPGNFLFSRNKKCGWLIDFNLATVQPKQSNSGKLRKQSEGRLLDRIKSDNDGHQGIEATFFHVHKNSSPHQQSSSLNPTSKAKSKHMEAVQQEKTSTPSGTPTRELRLSSQGFTSPAAQSRKHAEFASQVDWYNRQSVRLSPANGKVPVLKETAALTKKSRPKSTHKSPVEEQGRVSHNTETQKGEQVLPRYGRRELWELVQKSQHSTPPVSSIPSSQKKRVAAPQKRKHQKSLLDQSLPQSSAIPVSKASYIRTPTTGHLLKARGMHKFRKEGPCAGTKGYRAPEVLLKSFFQTEKMDVWSTGVSLFQLILGKSPFSSSSNLDQSLLDIAQFCGADAICTLAKEHNRESSLSKELKELKVQPVSLAQWCDKHTKRQNILPQVPPCLFDLLEKCLQVDPRSRISAKEALQHEFFASCRDSVPSLTSCMPHVN